MASHEDTHHNGADTRQQTPTIFSPLPPDLLHQIYSHILIASKHTTLRRASEIREIRGTHANPKIFNTALLLTSHSLTASALPFFHANNTFHTSLNVSSWVFRPNLPFHRTLDHLNPHLRIMRSVSLDYTIEWPAKGDKIWGAKSQEIDHRIMCSINELRGNAPGLRKLRIITLTIPDVEDDPVDLLGAGLAATALRRLLPRLQRLEIVTHGTEDALLPFRGAVAPVEEWRGVRIGEWCAVSVTEWNRIGMRARERRQEFYGRSEEGVWGFWIEQSEGVRRRREEDLGTEMERLRLGR